MRNLIILSVCLIALSCKNKQKVVSKEATTTVNAPIKDTSDSFPIKIIRQSCASLVAIILDEKYYSLGDETWAPYNVRMAAPYKNVVTIANMCAIPDTIKEEDVVTIKLIAEEEANKKPCVACMMMDYPPTKRIHIKFVEKVKMK